MNDKFKEELTESIYMSMRSTLGMIWCGANEDMRVQFMKDADSYGVINKAAVRDYLDRIVWDSVKRQFIIVKDNGDLAYIVETKIYGSISDLFGEAVVRGSLDQLSLIMPEKTPGGESRMKAVDTTLKTVTKVIFDKIITHCQAYKINMKVDMFSDDSNVYVEDGTANFSIPHIKYKLPAHNDKLVASFSKDEYRRIIELYLQHFESFPDVMDAIVAARFATTRKASALWLRCVSNWGKGVFFKAFEKCGALVETDEEELAAIAKSSTISKDAECFKRAIILTVDEFKRAGDFLKKMDDGISINPKFQLTQKVPVYFKLFTSDEIVQSMVPDKGTERQMANRFCYINELSGEIGPHYSENGFDIENVTPVIQDYAVKQLNARIEYYRGLGEVEAVKHSNIKSKYFRDKYKLSNTFKILNENLGELSDEVKQWAYECYIRYNKGQQLSKEERLAASKIGVVVNEGVGEAYLVIKSPKAVVNAYINTEISPPERVALGNRASEIGDGMVVEGSSRKRRAFFGNSDSYVNTTCYDLIDGGINFVNKNRLLKGDGRPSVSPAWNDLVVTETPKEFTKFDEDRTGINF